MATETVNVRFTQTGAKQVTRSMVGMTAAMAGVGYGAIRMGKSLITGADELNKLRNSAKVFSKDQGDANYRIQETVRISRLMNQSLGATAEVMQRVSLAQDSAGFGTETTVKVVENLSKAVAISGASAQEAEGALRQFGQGLAANRFSGQELNSVLEQTPMVAQILADSIGENGVAVGALKALGEAGELTTAVLVNAFGKANPKLDKMMGEFQFSLESRLVSIRREAVLFGETFSNQTGAIEGFRGILDSAKSTLIKLNEAMLAGGPEADKMIRLMKGMATAAATFTQNLPVEIATFTYSQPTV